MRLSLHATLSELERETGFDLSAVMENVLNTNPEILSQSVVVYQGPMPAADRRWLISHFENRMCHMFANVPPFRASITGRDHIAESVVRRWAESWAGEFMADPKRYKHVHRDSNGVPDVNRDLEPKLETTKT